MSAGEPTAGAAIGAEPTVIAGTTGLLAPYAVTLSVDGQTLRWRHLNARGLGPMIEVHASELRLLRLECDRLRWVEMGACGLAIAVGAAVGGLSVGLLAATIVLLYAFVRGQRWLSEAVLRIETHSQRLLFDVDPASMERARALVAAYGCAPAALPAAVVAKSPRLGSGDPDSR